MSLSLNASSSLVRQAGQHLSQRRSPSSRAVQPAARLSSSQRSHSPADQANHVRRRRVQVAAEKPSGGVGPSKDQPKAAPAEAPEDVPVWVRSERERELAAKEPQDLPFGLYLLFSSFVAIAAIGSIYEYSAGNPIFGVVEKESPLWAPILIFFAVTGLPMSGYLFYRSVKSANEASERADKIDGY